MTTAQCKVEIIKWCQSHASFISSEFDPPLTTQQLNAVFLTSNWKRVTKRRDIVGLKPQKTDNWIRRFDCWAPGVYGDLRAYVITDPTDTTMFSVEAHGE